MDANKICFILFLSGFAVGFAVSAGIAIFVYIRKLRRYRQENGDLRRQLECSNREIEQYGSQISAIRRDLEGCKSELAAGLDSITGIRDASKAIREQVKILEKYVSDTGRVYGNLGGNSGSDT